MKKLWDKLGILAFWASWPLLWVYLRFSRRTRVVVITEDDKVLLVKGWLGAGDWILPGGGLHKGEDPIAGAVREVAEETGMRLDESGLSIFKEGTASEHGLVYDYVALHVRIPSESATTRQRLEVADITWMPISELEGVSPTTRDLLHTWQKDAELLKL